MTRARQDNMKNDIQEQIKNDDSAIHDKICTDISDIRSDITAKSFGQAEFEERMTDTLHKQIKNAGTMVEQQTKKLCEEFKSELQETRQNIGVTRRDIL
jgi:polyhydroxyalkanoate synthesis regulator phasin